MSGGALTRRRFLAVSAAFALTGPAAAAAAPITRWRGQALGAVTEITLRGPKEDAGRALRAARRTLKDMEQRFSLYDPESDLVTLNRTGTLDRPAAAFVDLLSLCERIHAATRGHFDPTVQPLWQALARSGGHPDPAALQAAVERIDWSAVRFDANRVALRRAGMALTFNGIAQGYATDRVAATLAAEGFADTLVNIGEFRAGQGSWQIGIEDPAFGLVATRALEGRAIATSSPAALRFGNEGPGHILNPVRALTPARWSSVSVEAASAAEADGYSTAFALMERDHIASTLRGEDGLQRVLLVDDRGVTDDVS